MDLNVMAEIQDEKAAEMAAETSELDPETAEVAEEKRKTFDLPTNAAKVDPLR
jgi:hypothetical protein